MGRILSSVRLRIEEPTQGLNIIIRNNGLRALCASFSSYIA